MTHEQFLEGYRHSLASKDAGILRRLTPVRVKAWRKPNEDSPSPAVDAARFNLQTMNEIQAPLVRKVKEILARRGV